MNGYQNTYVVTAKGFCTWLVRQGRMPSNPLAAIGLVEQRGREVRVRRALSDAEIMRLLDVAGEYRKVYLTALTTGLRKGELAGLRWDDVRLDAARPFINVRASISKNRKVATMFLRQDVAAALAAIRTPDIADDASVFKMPSRKRFYGHLLAAGIEQKDGQGRIVDFHALRHSFITALSRAGVQPRVAMELARHSQIDLTMRVYTDAGLLGTGDAIDSLPSWQPPAPGLESAKATGTYDLPELPSKSATTNATKSATKTHTLPCATVHGNANISSIGHVGESRMAIGENGAFTGLSEHRGDRIRTCDLLVPNQAL